MPSEWDSDSDTEPGRPPFANRTAPPKKAARLVGTLGSPQSPTPAPPGLATMINQGIPFPPTNTVSIDDLELPVGIITRSRSRELELKWKILIGFEKAGKDEQKELEDLLGQKIHSHFSPPKRRRRPIPVSDPFARNFAGVGDQEFDNDFDHMGASQASTHLNASLLNGNVIVELDPLTLITPPPQDTERATEWDNTVVQARKRRLPDPCDYEYPRIDLSSNSVEDRSEHGDSLSIDEFVKFDRTPICGTESRCTSILLATFAYFPEYKFKFIIVPGMQYTAICRNPRNTVELVAMYTEDDYISLGLVPEYPGVHMIDIIDAHCVTACSLAVYVPKSDVEKSGVRWIDIPEEVGLHEHTLLKIHTSEQFFGKLSLELHGPGKAYFTDGVCEYKEFYVFFSVDFPGEYVAVLRLNGSVIEQKKITCADNDLYYRPERPKRSLFFTMFGVNCVGLNCDFMDAHGNVCTGSFDMGKERSGITPQIWMTGISSITLSRGNIPISGMSYVFPGFFGDKHYVFEKKVGGGVLENEIFDQAGEGRESQLTFCFSNLEVIENCTLNQMRSVVQLLCDLWIIVSVHNIRIVKCEALRNGRFNVFYRFTNWVVENFALHQMENTGLLDDLWKVNKARFPKNPTRFIHLGKFERPGDDLIFKFFCVSASILTRHDPNTIWIPHCGRLHTFVDNKKLRSLSINDFKNADDGLLVQRIVHKLSKRQKEHYHNILYNLFAKR